MFTSSIAAALVAVSYAMATLVYYRHELSLKSWHSEVESRAAQHAEGHRQADVRDTVYTHWVASALALHRIIRLPYGAPPNWSDPGADSDEGAHNALVHQNPLVKVMFAECAPTREGMERFRGLLRAELVRPGWLYAQYRRAADAYRTAHGGAPEACAYPLRFGEELLSTGDGDRWPFVQQLYRGDFDTVLAERVTQFVDGDGLDELFDDVASFEVTSGAHPDESAAALLSEIADDPEPAVPQSVLSPLAFIDYGNTTMQSTLWWPHRLASPRASIESRTARSLRIRGAVVHQAVRVDLSEPIPLTALTGATELGDGPDDSTLDDTRHGSRTEMPV